ncbi:MAG: hypothetical protein U9N55_08715 [candidate division Zixibacteria bacterium]|nr:hypothetical protein [candidate division Zixibacteria bacterium]
MNVLNVRNISKNLSLALMKNRLVLIASPEMFPGWYHWYHRVEVLQVVAHHLRQVNVAAPDSVEDKPFLYRW